MDCRHDSTAQGDTGFSMKTLLGDREDPVAAVYARQLTKLVAGATKRPLLLSLALSDRSPEAMRGIIDAVAADPVWA